MAQGQGQFLTYIARDLAHLNPLSYFGACPQDVLHIWGLASTMQASSIPRGDPLQMAIGPRTPRQDVLVNPLRCFTQPLHDIFHGCAVYVLDMRYVRASSSCLL